MSRETERNYYKKQTDSVKRSSDRARSLEQARTPGDRLRKTEATDAVTRRLKEASPAEKDAFYKKQRDSIEQSKTRMNASTEKKAYYENQGKQIEASRKSLDDFTKERKLGDQAEKKKYRVPDPDWFKDK